VDLGNTGSKVVIALKTATKPRTVKTSSLPANTRVPALSVYLNYTQLAFLF